MGGWRAGGGSYFILARTDTKWKNTPETQALRRENLSCLTSCLSRGSPPKWQGHVVAFTSLWQFSSRAVGLREAVSVSKYSNCGWSLREPPCPGLRVFRHAHMCVSLGAALGKDLISDFGRLCAGVLPLGGVTVRCQTEFGRAY